MLIRIGKIETAKLLVDSSVRTGNEQASKLKHLKLPRQEAQIRYERARIKFIGRNLDVRLANIIKAFPRWEKLSEFYYELAKCTLDTEKVTEHLGKTDKFMRQARQLTSMYEDKASKARTEDDLARTMQAYIGRLHRDTKSVEIALLELDKARKTMREYPSVKDMPTVAITGFPNVGKTTLLYKLTGSKPEIQNYSFTTKNINIGYIKESRIQVMDTPGNLNRKKMNPMEKQADITLKYLAKVVVYVFDPTDTYSMSDQIKLYESVKELGKPVLCYVSKTDIAEMPAALADYNPATSPEELRMHIEEIVTEQASSCQDTQKDSSSQGQNG